jgi:cytochrome c oxidase subunit II
VRTPLFQEIKRRWPLLMGVVILAPLLLSACGENTPSILGGNPPSILNTAGPVAQDESIVFWAILIIAAIVFVAVEGMLVYSIFRFRERPGMGTPRQNHGDMRLEIAWTVAPMVVLFIVLFFTIRGIFQVAPEAEPMSSNTVTVQVAAHQWWWEFYYPQYNITTADTMVIPANTDIHVDLYSNNVIHSFWVPQLTGKTDVVPGHDNTKWFIADANDVGKDYLGICAEYCGTQHGNMRFTVHVDSTDDFRTWASQQQQAAVMPAKGSLAAQGAQIFSQQCSSCHGIVGNNLKPSDIANPAVACNAPNANCKIGPNLTHFGSRNLIAGGILTWSKSTCKPDDPNLLQDCNLAKWLNDPQGIKPGSDMVIGQLDPSQIKALVAYLESLN